MTAGSLPARAPARWRRAVAAMAAHEHLTAAGVLALLVLVHLFPVLFGGRALLPTTGLYYDVPWIGSAPGDLASFANRQLEDVAASYYPWHVLARELVHAGTFPAWNPFPQGGTPFWANVEVAWLSPFTWATWVLPLTWAFGFVAALKLWLAGFGTYLLARELRLGFWPALLAGVAFALCAFNVVWLSHGVQVSVAVTMPWLLLLSERVIRRSRPVDGLALTGAVAFALVGGHPGTQLHVLAATALYVVLRAACEGGVAGRERLRRLGLVGAAMVLGALVTAVAILPAQQAAEGTAGAMARAQGSVEFAGTHMNADILRTVVFPDWWGRPSEQLAAGPANYNERTFYAGAVAAVLALVALVSRAGWRRKLPFVVLGVIGCAVAARAPLVHGLVTSLPLFDRVQDQRMLLWTQLAIAVLGAFGLQAVFERPRRGATWAAVGLAALAVGVALLALPYEGGDLGRAVEYVLDRSAEAATEGALALASVIWFAVFAVALIALLVLARLRPRALPLVGALVVLVAAFDMLHFADGYQPMPPADQAVPPRTPALAYLQHHVGDGRIGAQGETVPGDTATLYGLRDVRGYDQPQPSRRFFYLWQTTQPAQNPGAPYFINELSEASLQVLSLLGMRYLLTAPGTPAPGGSALEPVYAGADATVLRNPAAAPRAFVARDVELVDELGAEITTVIEGAFDPRSSAVLRADRLGPARPDPAGGRGEVEVVGESHDEVALRASLTRQSLVVLDDAWTPGWEVEVDGQPARALEANVVLRGVVVPAGTHEITWRFHVPGLRAGALLSLLGVLLCAGWGVALAVRSRRAAS